jgi:site-specific DNA recombinase
MTSAYFDVDDFSSSDFPAFSDEPQEDSLIDHGSLDDGEAVLYLRVSDKKQMATASDYDPEGNSIPTQQRIGQAKADALGVSVWREYVEPGRSATSLEKRVAFQEMMAELKAENQRRKKDERPHVRYVIVYMMSRAFRNALEELQTKAQLAKMGITLVSAKENFGDGYLGDAMQGILAIFNELQSRANGEDVKTKMQNKARNGGTVGRAPLGYLNAGDSSLGHEVRTVIIDPARGPLVRLAFELYATGNWTLADLSDELYDRGLRTRPRNGPAKKVGVSKLSQMLRDRYYIGIVTFKGEEYTGRHEPLISLELFEQVYDIAEPHTTAQDRRRVHHHYLKGSLFCGTCATKGIAQRMIMQQTVNRHGAVYLYFFCRGNQNGTCSTPHVPVSRLEEAVEDRYASLKFNPSFIEEVRAHLTAALDEEKAAKRLLRDQLTAELKTMDSQEENLLDLAADGDLPKSKIRARLQDIEHRRQRLTERLSQTSEELSEAAHLVEIALTLMQAPQASYLRADEKIRRTLNQAIFHALYVQDDKISGHDLKEPFASLHALQDAPGDAAAPESPYATSTPGTAVQHPRPPSRGLSAADNPNADRPLPSQGKGPARALDALLAGIRSGTGSSSARGAPPTGLEPVTCRLTAGCSAN